MDDPLPSDGLSTYSLLRVEGEHIEKTLNHLHWNRSKAAEVLGISLPTLRAKIRKYKITAPINDMWPQIASFTKDRTALKTFFYHEKNFSPFAFPNTGQDRLGQPLKVRWINMLHITPIFLTASQLWYEYCCIIVGIKFSTRRISAFSKAVQIEIPFPLFSICHIPGHRVRKPVAGTSISLPVSWWRLKWNSNRSRPLKKSIFRPSSEKRTGILKKPRSYSRSMYPRLNGRFDLMACAKTIRYNLPGIILYTLNQRRNNA